MLCAGKYIYFPGADTNSHALKISAEMRLDMYLQFLAHFDDFLIGADNGEVFYTV